MEGWPPLLRQTLAIAWRRRWLLAATAWGFCIVGWIVVALVPNYYESETRLYVDTDAVLTPLLHGLAIDTATAGQLEVMQKTLLSRPNLVKLVGMTNLELAATAPDRRERLLLRLANEIKVQSQGRNIFTISYRSTNAQLAHDVVGALLSIFMEKATGNNQSDMRNAQQFLRRQLASYEAQLQTAEQRRADFRRKYLDILPLESNGGLSRLDTARLDVANLAAGLKDASAKRDALKEEARITPPTISTRPAGSAASPLAAQLAEAESRLADLRTRFTERHPDVIAARRLVDTLRAQASKEPTAGALVGGPPLANPVYEQVRMRLIEAEASVSSLQARLDTAQKERDRLDALARAAPGVEAQYQNLDRDYNVIRKNYEELLARREASNITEAADTSADKVQLRVIDPPTLPVIPTAPNRLLLVSAVLVGGIASAAGLAIMLGQRDRSIADLNDLRELGLPVLGGLSMAPIGARTINYTQALGLMVAGLALVAIYGGLTAKVLSSQGL